MGLRVVVGVTVVVWLTSFTPTCRAHGLSVDPAGAQLRAVA